MTQRVGVCVDLGGTMGETPDEERDSILHDLSRLGLEPELVFYGHDPLAIPFEKQIDVLVVDYGMLAVEGSAVDWTRRLLRWADEHPSSILLVWSSMTVDGFVFELRDSIEREAGEQLDLLDSEWTPPWPANVRAYQAGNKWYARWGDGDSVDWLRASDEYVRSWFGVTGETALDKEIAAYGPLVPPSDRLDGPPPRGRAVAEPETKPEAPAAVVSSDVVWGRPCSRCLRSGSWEHPDHQRCVPCGLYQAFCTCDVVELPRHPVLDGTPLLIGDRVRVTGREPQPGGPLADGVVTEISFVRPHGEVWIHVGDYNEIFQEEDLTRWK